MKKMAEPDKIDYIALANKLCESYVYTKLAWKPWSEEDAKTYVNAVIDSIDRIDEQTAKEIRIAELLRTRDSQDNSPR